MDMVESIGKCSKKVAILLTPDMKKGYDLLLATRDEVGIQIDNVHMFAQVCPFWQSGC
jgi:hypothetical protein